MTRHSGPWAHPPRNLPEPKPVKWLVIWAIGFALAGVGLALLFGDVPPHYEAPMGYDICNTARC